MSELLQTTFCFGDVNKIKQASLFYDSVVGFPHEATDDKEIVSSYQVST